jgi:putative CocE/NonD family hydrolase
LSDAYGIVISKDVMVPMRDGIRLALDLYRPARDGELVPGRWPTIVCITPYDKGERRYTEIADFFVPHGYAVVLQDLRDRHKSEGTKEYFHSATPHTGEDGYDTIEWIAAQPWSNGRTGMVGSSYACITQMRTALEAPPHLTAIWPDVAPTNVYHHQTREGGAMQLHMFWALYIHAADAQEVQADPPRQDEVFDDLRNLRQLFWEWPWHKGELALRHVPALDETLELYATRGAYDEWWSRKVNDFTAYWADHGDVASTMTTGWFDGFPHSMTEYYAAMAERSTKPQRLIVGPWSHVGMRGDVSYTLDVDFGEDSVWGVRHYFEQQLAWFNRFLPDEATGQPADEAPVKIFVMGGGSGRRTQGGKLDHGGAWRGEWEWPLARAVPTAWHLHGDGSLRSEAPAPDGSARHFTYAPEDPVPTIGGNYCAVGEFPKQGEGMEPMWQRLLNPALQLKNIMTPGPADQKESADFFTAREPFRRLSERPDVLVYQTEPLASPVEITGRGEVELWIASTAVDTDFTAKLIDVYPPNEDYPEGYDMLINDSIIRTRYREGWEREVMMEPGTPYLVRIQLPPTSNVFAAGHRIRIDVSSSNFPRLERNPNTGEPIGRHTRMIKAEQTVFSDADHPSRAVLPVIPA